MENPDLILASSHITARFLKNDARRVSSEKVLFNRKMNLETLSKMLGEKKKEQKRTKK